MKHEEIRKADLASSFQNSVVSVLVDKTIHAAKVINAIHILLAGGVAANRGLREKMDEEVKRLDGVKLTYPSMKYCTDNAAMIAVSGYFKYITENK